MHRFHLLTVVLLLSLASPCTGQTINLNYAPSPPDNPMKGLVPYWDQADAPNSLPCSIEFNYFALSELMTGPNSFDWGPVEELLDTVSGRGRQATFRVYTEFPGRRMSIPQYLIDEGTEMFEYVVDGEPHWTPDYRDQGLQDAILAFITAFGERYDGDPRIAFLTAGMLGQWGEWHDYPRSDLFATPEFQAQVLDTFESSFTQTIVHLRYPAGPDDEFFAENVSRPFGYHDDSFAFATVPTGDPEDDWFFGNMIAAAGAEDKWKTQPIGGEIRPEVWGCVFDTPSCAPDGQEFENCVQAIHASWLMDSGMFGPMAVENSDARKAAAIRRIQRMGYELYVSTAVIEATDRQFSLQLQLENRGVAPFYYKWPVEIVLGDGSGNVTIVETDWNLTETIPGDEIRWNHSSGIPAGVSTVESVAIRVKLPFENLRPLRFANETQQDDGMLIIR
ncbi:MAG: DUF4832 domain-containing protein [Planctomycetota bacterium]